MNDVPKHTQGEAHHDQLEIAFKNLEYLVRVDQLDNVGVVSKLTLCFIDHKCLSACPMSNAVSQQSYKPLGHELMLYLEDPNGFQNQKDFAVVDCVLQDLVEWNDCDDVEPENL